MSLDLGVWEYEGSQWDNVARIIPVMFKRCEKSMGGITMWLKQMRIEDRLSTITKSITERVQDIEDLDHRSKSRFEGFELSLHDEVSKLRALLSDNKTRIDDLEHRLAKQFQITVPTSAKRDPWYQSFQDKFNKVFPYNGDDDSLSYARDNLELLWKLIGVSLHECSFNTEIEGIKATAQTSSQILSHTTADIASKHEQLRETLRQSRESLNAEQLHINSRLDEVFAYNIDLLKVRIERASADIERMSEERHVIIALDEKFEARCSYLTDDLTATKSLLQDQSATSDKNFQSVSQRLKQSRSDSDGRCDSIIKQIELQTSILRGELSKESERMISLFDQSKAESLTASDQLRKALIQKMKGLSEVIKESERSQEAQQVMLQKGINDVYPRLRDVTTQMASLSHFVASLHALTNASFNRNLREKMSDFIVSLWSKADKTETAVEKLIDTLLVHQQHVLESPPMQQTKMVYHKRKNDEIPLYAKRSMSSLSLSVESPMRNRLDTAESHQSSPEKKNASNQQLSRSTANIKQYHNSQLEGGGGGKGIGCDQPLTLNAVDKGFLEKTADPQPHSTGNTVYTEQKGTNLLAKTMIVKDVSGGATSTAGGTTGGGGGGNIIENNSFVVKNDSRLSHNSGNNTRGFSANTGQRKSTRFKADQGEIQTGRQIILPLHGNASEASNHPQFSQTATGRIRGRLNEISVSEAVRHKRGSTAAESEDNLVESKKNSAIHQQQQQQNSFGYGYNNIDKPAVNCTPNALRIIRTTRRNTQSTSFRGGGEDATLKKDLIDIKMTVLRKQSTSNAGGIKEAGSTRSQVIQDVREGGRVHEGCVKLLDR